MGRTARAQMDRRLFLLSGLAGAADPKALVRAAADPAPVTDSGDPAFDAWAQDFVARAVGAGWSEALLRAQFAGLAPDPKVIAADHRQPEFSRPVGDYMRAAVSPGRIQTGKQKAAEQAAWLDRIVGRFGVNPDILVAIWGVESGFGAVQGDFDVIRSLATLAADGRRRAWAEGELFAALRIVGAGLATRAALKGSWAGAMGQTQLEPGEFLVRAQDIDGDGRADIWGSSADALGSTADILNAAGWVRGASWAHEAVLPPAFDYGLTEGPRHPPAWWAALGVRRADGQAWSAADAGQDCQLVAPAGAGGPAFLLFPNHFVIRAYNNSTSYALAVGLIADGVAGAPPLTVAWPKEAPISLEDRQGAQKALAALGFDPGAPDGLIGTRTRASLRGWQAARGLVADGHLTVDLAGRLQQEAAAH